MMKLIVYFSFFICSHSVIIPIPEDCFIVKTNFGATCYKFYSTILTHKQSRLECLKHNGVLALVTDDYTWNLITENILHKTKSSSSNTMWARPYVFAHDSTLQDTLDKKQPIFWNGGMYLEYYDRCMYAVKENRWNFKFENCNNFLPFLCELYVSYCNVSDLLIPNANYNNCHSSYLIKNGDSIEVECWSGFVLSDLESFVRCENGSWREPIPKCVPGCKSPGQRKNSKPFPNKLQYNVGEEVAYICDDNYFSWKDFKKAHFVLTCQKDGKWSEENSYCTREKFTTEIIYSANDGNITLNCTLNGNISWYQSDKDFQTKTLLSKNSLKNFKIDASQTKKEGIYFCQKFENEMLQFGRIFYKVYENETCHAEHNIRIKENKIQSTEGHSVIFSCNLHPENQKIRWLKNDNEISNYNVDVTVLPNFDLYLKNVKLSDAGIYKCEIELLNEPHYCKHYVVYELTVTASIESICGLVLESNMPYQAPWLVILQQDDEVLPFCYGTILNNEWIVTSASCLFNLGRKKEIKIFAKLQPKDNDENIYPVKYLKVHPEYKNSIFANDIGLVKLEKPVVFTKFILPICLSPISFTSKEKCDETNIKLEGEVSGWGSLLIDDVTEMIFSIENMTYISREECSKFYGFSKDMFCAKNSNIENIYAGDSGSPFVVKYNDRKYLMGIFNWGARITQMGDYDYFTSFHSHYDWVRQTIEDN